MNLAAIIRWLYPHADPLKDFRVEDDGSGPVIAFWDATAIGVAQPTEAEVMAQEAAFLAAGGFQTQIRQIAKAIIDGSTPMGLMLRAILLELVEHMNERISQNMTDLLTWLGTQGTLTNRAQLNNFVPLQPTFAQARQAVKDRITNAEVDS